VGFEKDGSTEQARVEITRIDKKELPQSQFEYPPAYRVVDLGQMIAGMAALQGQMPTLPGGRPMPTGMPAMRHARPDPSH
jgi:hypothetical protein